MARLLAACHASALMDKAIVSCIPIHDLIMIMTGGAMWLAMHPSAEAEVVIAFVHDRARECS